MASPFAQYKGEQIQPINILPYTGQTAEMMGKGIASAFSGIGNAIAKYSEAKRERDTLADMVQGGVSKYVVQDLQNPEDKEAYKASDDAPAHSADLINLAIKEGDGDVARGIAGMPISKLRAWANLDARFEKQVQQETENRFKETALKTEIDRVKIAKDVQDLEKEKHNLSKQITEFNQRVSLSELGLRTSEVGLKWNDFKLKEKQAEEAKAEKDKELAKRDALEKLVKDVQDTGSIPTSLKVNEQSTVLEEVGDIFAPDGSLIASNVMLRQGIEALGLNPSDVVTAEKAVAAKQVGADYGLNQIGKYLTQNDKFDIKSGFSGAVQNGYTDQFIRNAFRQADAWSLEKTGKSLSGFERFFPQGIDGKIENPAKAFELAQQFLKNNQFVDYMKSRHGVQTVPDGAVFNKAFYSVTGTQNYQTPVVREVTLTDYDKEKFRYEQMAKAAGGADKLPMSWTQYVMSQPDRFLPRSTIKMPDGTTVNVTKMGDKGNWMTDAQILSASGTGGGTMDSKFKMDLITANNWLRQFEKPTDIGPMVIQFPKGGLESFSGDWNTDYPVLKKGFEDVRLATQIATKMREFARKGVLEKGLSPADREEFNQLVMRATTFRKHFIAGGQETEPDAQRLFEQIGALTNMTRLFSSDTHLKAIDAFEATIRDQVVANSRSAGFRVAVKGSQNKYNLGEIVSKLEKETGVKSTAKPQQTK